MKVEDIRAMIKLFEDMVIDAQYSISTLMHMKKLYGDISTPCSEASVIIEKGIDIHVAEIEAYIRDVGNKVKEFYTEIDGILKQDGVIMLEETDE